jgi:acetoin utilization deacetylase AcuC-like enzyme
MADEVGAGEGAGLTINLPLPAGTDGKTLIAAYRSRLLPAALRFRPEIVFISAGFDSRRGDPLGGFLLDDDDFAMLTQLMREVADNSAHGRMISVLEGGYALDGLARAIAAHIGALTG